MRVKVGKSFNRSSWWRRFWPQLVIVSVWLAVVITNYRPGSWLTGWDNLHPEWDPTYDLYRTLNAVWQEYQGVGLLGGMAHAADLVRQVIVLLVSAFLPRSLIRYSLLFGQLLLGGLGCFRLFGYLFTDRSERLPAKLASLAAALFYLLNLGTVQNFYVAFEPFYWFYGTLPWLLAALYRAWRYPDQRAWLWWTLLSFASTPFAYVQTNFIVYTVLLSVFSTNFLLSRRPHVSLWEKVKRVATAAVIVIVTNLFWLLPVAYFVASGGSQTTIKSQINQISTREVTAQNQAFGNWRDILLLRGYWFVSQDLDSTDDDQSPIAFMQAWIAEPATGFFGIVFAGLLIVGGGYLLIYRRDWRTYSVITGLLAMCGLLLINHFDSTLLGQIFRSPYIKVIVPLSLLYSLLVGASFLLLARLVRARILLFAFGGFAVALGLYTIPIFGGHFIYHNLRPSVPADYEQLFEFMHSQPAASRVALLPAETLYGWQHTTWGYRGIGFYWFGLHQSILNRAFDVWSFDNEEFYQELHYARLLGDGALFRHVLDKYDVRYLVYDQSIHRRGRDTQSFYQAWQDLISAAVCTKIHTSDLIQVYDCGAASDQYVLAPERYFVSNTSQFHQILEPMSLTAPFVTGAASAASDQPFAFLYEREPGNEQISYRSRPDGLTEITIAADITGNDYQDIAIPSPVEASHSSVLVSVDRQDAATYRITLTPLFQLELNGQRQEIFPPLSFTAPALAEEGEIYLDFGSDYARVTPGAAASNSAVMALQDFDQPQVWRYFSANRARSRGANLNVSLHDTVELDVPTVFWEPWRETEVLTLGDKLTSLAAVIVSKPYYLRSYATPDNANCDVIFRGSVDREEYGEHGYTYHASDFGSYCDTFYDSRLDGAKHSFLLRLDAENVTGLPLSYYFWDVNNQVQSWETLLPDGRATQTFSFPRATNQPGTAIFDLHSSSRSIAGEESTNILEQTVAYVAPVHELAGIIASGREAAPPRANPLRITAVRKAGTSQYRVEVEFTRLSTGLLVLTQGYHAGWRAQIDGQQLPHERYDDWANAWTIDPALCPDGRCVVTISFWPQWLGWVGLAISVATGATSGLGLCWLAYRRSRQPGHVFDLRAAFQKRD